MANELTYTGKLKEKFELKKGTGAKGEWKKQDFLLWIPDEKYPKEVLLSAWGKSVDTLEESNIGDTIKAHFELSAREYNGKFYNDCKAWKIESIAKGSGTPATQSEKEEQAIMNTEDDSSQLPF